MSYQFLKRLVPQRLLDARTRFINRRRQKSFEGLSVKETFSEIYGRALWGRSDNSGDPFCSGTGSHNQAIVQTYVDAINLFFTSLSQKPTAVDLGCGDFAVGAKLSGLAERYVGCDVVDALIARNQTKFAELPNVEFLVVDLTEDALPQGDVAFLRQVLQHLSNAQIQAILPKLLQYEWLILTEHLPTGSFEANRDKPTGPGVRVEQKSGVVITAPPFGVRPLSERVLCEVPEATGTVRTTLYRLHQ